MAEFPLAAAFTAVAVVHASSNRPVLAILHLAQRSLVIVLVFAFFILCFLLSLSLFFLIAGIPHLHPHRLRHSGDRLLLHVAKRLLNRVTLLYRELPWVLGVLHLVNGHTHNWLLHMLANGQRQLAHRFLVRVVCGRIVAIFVHCFLADCFEALLGVARVAAFIVVGIGVVTLVFNLFIIVALFAAAFVSLSLFVALLPLVLLSFFTSLFAFFLILDGRAAYVVAWVDT